MVRAETPAKVTYAEHVRSIFQQHCFACHGQDTRKSDLALDTYEDAVAGGAGGEVLFAGDLESSRLWALVNHDDSPEMPPEQDKLPADKLTLIKAWIEGGLLKDAGSEAKPTNNLLAGGMAETAAAVPQGEPVMPENLLQEPVAYAEQPGAVDALDASPWAPVAAVGGQRQIVLYHTETGDLLGILPYPEGQPHVVRFSRDGSRLLVGGGHPGALGNTALFDVQTGMRLATLGEESDAVLAADLSPNQTLVALGGPKRNVRTYRVADGQLAYQIEKHTDWVTAIAFSPDGKLLATAGRGGGVYLWDSARGLERADLKGHQAMVTSLAWRPDSQIIASGSEDGTVRLWQTDGTQIKSWAAHEGGTQSVAFSSTGELVTTGRDGKVRIWQADGKHLRDVLDAPEATLVARFTHDGTRVVAGDWLGSVPLLEAAGGEPVAQLPPNPPTLSMRMEQAAAQLAAASEQAKVADAALAAADAQLAAAVKAQAEAAASREASQATLSQAEKAHATVKTLYDAYQQMATQLQAAHESRQAELSLAASELAAAAEARKSVEQQLAEQQKQIEQLTSQMEQLKQQQAELTAASEALAGDAAAQAEAVAQAQAKMAAAERAAAAAAAKQQQFAEAEAARQEAVASE